MEFRNFSPPLLGDSEEGARKFLWSQKHILPLIQHPLLAGLHQLTNYQFPFHFTVLLRGKRFISIYFKNKKPTPVNPK
jgi:hypothetical protein